jgi:hypothetical protein
MPPSGRSAQLLPERDECLWYAARASFTPSCDILRARQQHHDLPWIPERNPCRGVRGSRGQKKIVVALLASTVRLFSQETAWQSGEVDGVGSPAPCLQYTMISTDVQSDLAVHTDAKMAFE